MALWILGLATLVILIPARGYISPYTPLGDDASSHITAIATLAEAFATGSGWWSDDYNGGFPMALYYQPLPHLVSAALCALFGGHSVADETYKILLTAMLVLQPWAVFAGLRRAGFGPLESALAGFAAPLLMDGITFGYHSKASLTVGLYTQAWGNVALPLAFGELAAIARGDGRVRAAIAACALTASTHMFYAIALVIPGLAFAVLGRAWRRSAWQLPAVGIGSFVVLAPWMMPLNATQAFFGGWPFGRAERVDGYGWSGVFGRIVDGTLLDGPNAPVLLGFAGLGLIGCVAAAVSERSRARRRAAVFALVLLGWAVVGSAGRAGLGEWIDRLNPLHDNVQLFRYGAVLQFACLAPIGVGLALVARAAERVSRTWIVGALVLAAAVVFPVRGGVDQLEVGFRTIDDTTHFRPQAYVAAVDYLRSDPTGGRMYVGKRSGLRGHYHSGLMAWAAMRPGAQSYGVGLHDSLHFYTLEYLNPEHPGTDALADLFDFRLIVHSPGADLSGLGELEQVYGADGYRVSHLKAVSGHAVEVFREADRITGTPRGVRRSIRAWMWGNGPRTRQTVVVEIDDPRSREDLVGNPPAPEAAMQFEPAEPAGRTLESAQDGARFSARVVLDEPALVVAKIGFHPFWRVTVDGERAETLFVFPGFVAVRAEPGEHVVEGEFRWPASSHWLLLLAPLPLVFGRRFQRAVERRIAGRWRSAAAAAEPSPSGATAP